MVKGFGCRPVVTYPAVLRAGVRTPSPQRTSKPRFAPGLLLLRKPMPKCLTPAQIEQYREEGCVFPIRIISETEAAEFRRRLEAFERRTGGLLEGDPRHK